MRLDFLNILEPVDSDLEMKQHASLGNFIHKFELMVFAIRNAIGSILRANSLNEQVIIDILLADLTVDPLLIKLRSLTAFQLSSDPIRLKKIDTLFPKIKKLIEQRNEIIHGTWILGAWQAADDELRNNNSIRGYKAKLTSSGLKQHSFTFTPVEIDHLIKKVELADHLLWRLLAGYHHVETLDVLIDEIGDL